MLFFFQKDKKRVGILFFTLFRFLSQSQWNNIYFYVEYTHSDSHSVVSERKQEHVLLLTVFKASVVECCTNICILFCSGVCLLINYWKTSCVYEYTNTTFSLFTKHSTLPWNMIYFLYALFAVFNFFVFYTERISHDSWLCIFHLKIYLYFFIFFILF